VTDQQPYFEKEPLSSQSVRNTSIPVKC